MSWFSRLFNRPELHQATEVVHLLDYATFDGRTGRPVPPSGSVGILHLDFVSVFPAILWASDTSYDAEYPQGFSYKVLSARHEPSGEYECVVLRDLGDRGRTILRRFRLPKDQFPAEIDLLVRKYEPAFGVQFARRDFSQARTPEEFQRLVTGGQTPPLPSDQPPPLP